MKNIRSYAKYNGGPIIPNVLYTGKNFQLDGKYDFEIYGTAKDLESGILISGRHRGDGYLSIELKPNASIVFWRVPVIRDHPKLVEGLPDLPEYQDDQTRAIMHMIESVLADRGFVRPGETDLDDPDDQYDEDDEEFPVSNLFLVHDMERLPDSIESGGDASLEARSGSEAEEAEQEDISSEESPSFPSADQDSPRVGGADSSESGGEPSVEKRLNIKS